MQSIKIRLIILAFVISSLLPASGSRLNIETDEAFIDFAREEFAADGGVDFIYPNPDPERVAKIRAYRLSKVPNKNLILATDGVIFEQGDNKVEAQEIMFNLDDMSTRMREGVSYVRVDGAPAGNDRIYYGGEEFIARYPDEAYVKNAWFTTSRKALKMTEGDKDPKEVLPYHIRSKKISVYPEEKIIAYNNFLYIKGVPVLWLPWYASSLKADTQAPLFPIFGSSTEEGSYMIWGIDYGHRRNNYFNGSLALRTSSKKGWYIDSWENVYRIGGNDDNKGKFSLTDALIMPKGDYEKEYKFEHSHNYKGSAGELKWKYNDQTINTINAVKERDENFRNVEKTLKRLELETDLKNLGPNDDISVKANIQYISNTEVVEKLVGDAIERAANDSEIDNDIKTNIKLTKDNRNYRLYLHYDYLKDIDPGSTYRDTESRREQREGQLNLKRYKIDMRYNNKVEDVWRRLTDSEREDAGTRLNHIEGWAEGMPYTPFTVKRYDRELEERSLALGPYSIFNSSFQLKTEWHESMSTRELNREIDPFRADLNISERQKEYHRSDNILYEKLENEKIILNLSQKSRNLIVELGTDTNTYIDRSDVDEGIKYVNESEYNDIRVSDRRIDLYSLGTLNLSGSRRHDNFTDGDEAFRISADLRHNINLYDNSGHYLRVADLKLDNSFGFFIEKHDHKEGSYDYILGEIANVHNKEDLSYYRLNNRKDKLNFNNRLSFELGNTTTIYNFDMKNQFNANDKNWLTDRGTLNSLEFQIDRKRSIFLSYRTQEYFLKNDNDENSKYYNQFDKEFFRERYTNRLNIELADDSKALKYQRVESERETREREYISKVGEELLGLSQRTNTYGDLLTTETTLEDTYSYDFSLGKYSLKLNYSTWENQIYSHGDEENTRERTRDRYGLELRYGKEIEQLLRFNYEKFIDEIDEINNERKYTLRYEYKDNRSNLDDAQETLSFVDASGRYRMELSQEELEELDRRYREEVRRERGLGLDIMGLGDRLDDGIIYKRYFTVYGEAVTNEEYLKYSSDFMKSVKYFQVRGEFHYNNLRIDYRYDQRIKFELDNEELWGIKREVTERKHEASLLTKFGEANYAWKFRGDITYKQEVKEEERELDKWSISLEKEFDFIQYGIDYEREWNKDKGEYDWLWRVRVALTTFPDKGIGAGSRYKNGELNSEFKGGI